MRVRVSDKVNIEGFFRLNPKDNTMRLDSPDIQNNAFLVVVVFERVQSEDREEEMGSSDHKMRKSWKKSRQPNTSSEWVRIRQGLAKKKAHWTDYNSPHTSFI